jgi:hypothetical protein
MEHEFKNIGYGWTAMECSPKLSATLIQFDMIELFASLCKANLLMDKKIDFELAKENGLTFLINIINKKTIMICCNKGIK